MVREMGFSSWGMLHIGFLVVLVVPFCAARTRVLDVIAANSLYASLGSPPLTGWTSLGGDPCGKEWQGVNCDSSKITEIRLNGLNLEGALYDSIANFESIEVLDLSNNSIGGTIPSSLPLTLKNLSLSDNHLSDEIPDSFQQLDGLIYLDLSGNNLTGQLPPSFRSLSSLKILHLQNNKLSGILDVLRDLPLVDLNIENNLFSGPIPSELMNIPDFRKDGNPFNTTILAPPPTEAPFASPPVPYGDSSPPVPYGDQPNSPSPSILQPPQSEKERKVQVNNKLTWIAVPGILAVAFVVCFLVWKRSKGSHIDENNEKYGVDASNESAPKTGDENGIDSGRIASSFKLQDEQHVIQVMKTPTSLRSGKDCGTDMKDVYMNSMPPQPTITALPSPPVEGAIVNPVVPALLNKDGHKSASQNFTIASLQQYTNSFPEENFIGEGVYMAELPDGQLLAVKNLNSKSSELWNKEEFAKLVSAMSKLKHPNILDLVGYCNEHGQRLLVYKYCRNGSLYDALHVDEEIHSELSWDARVRIALGTAKALQYLHEVCEPPIMHRNLKSSNVLLHENFAVNVSDCILASQLISGSPDQLSGSHVSSGYGAPELDIGHYTCQSDVYSLGIVMLELLTARKPFDRSRSRGEQSLVRWAVPRLHDIDAISKMVDPSLNGAFPVKSLSRFADIISQCVQFEPGFRPNISEIVQDLLHMVYNTSTISRKHNTKISEATEDN